MVLLNLCVTILYFIVIVLFCSQICLATENIYSSLNVMMGKISPHPEIAFGDDFYVLAMKIFVAKSFYDERNYFVRKKLDSRVLHMATSYNFLRRICSSLNIFIDKFNFCRKKPGYNPLRPMPFLYSVFPSHLTVLSLWQAHSLGTLSLSLSSALSLLSLSLALLISL